MRGGWVEREKKRVRSIPVDSQNPDLVHGGKLANDGGNKGDEVEYQIVKVIVGVMGGTDEEEDGDDRQHLPGWGVLFAVIQLLPESQLVIVSLAMEEGVPLGPMQEDKGDLNRKRNEKEKNNRGQK